LEWKADTMDYLASRSIIRVEQWRLLINLYEASEMSKKHEQLVSEREI